MTSDPSNSSESHPPAEPPPSAGQLHYRAAAADTADLRQDLRNTHKQRFKTQMHIGSAVGVLGTLFWLFTLFATSSFNVTLVNSLFFGTLLAWTITSISLYRTGGFVVGLLIALATLLLITGCGLGVVCSGVFR